jgi:hypothetical protein
MPNRGLAQTHRNWRKYTYKKHFLFISNTCDWEDTPIERQRCEKSKERREKRELLVEKSPGDGDAFGILFD